MTSPWSQLSGEYSFSSCRSLFWDIETWLKGKCSGRTSNFGPSRLTLVPSAILFLPGLCVVVSETLSWLDWPDSSRHLERRPVFPGKCDVNSNLGCYKRHSKNFCNFRASWECRSVIGPVVPLFPMLDIGTTISVGGITLFFQWERQRFSDSGRWEKLANFSDKCT